MRHIKLVNYIILMTKLIQFHWLENETDTSLVITKMLKPNCYSNMTVGRCMYTCVRVYIHTFHTIHMLLSNCK